MKLAGTCIPFWLSSWTLLLQRHVHQKVKGGRHPLLRSLGSGEGTPHSSFQGSCCSRSFTFPLDANRRGLSASVKNGFRILGNMPTLGKLCYILIRVGSNVDGAQQLK